MIHIHLNVIQIHWHYGLANHLFQNLNMDYFAKASLRHVFVASSPLRVSGLMLPCAGGHQDEEQLGRWDMMGSGRQRSAWNIIELNEELSMELFFVINVSLV